MTMTTDTVLETNLAGVKRFKKGKVRDVYDLGEHLLIVASDRVSAFDVVIPTGIPNKGAVLTALSVFWFDMIQKASLVPHHLVSADIAEITRRYPALAPHRAVLEKRSMLVVKGNVVPVECVVRGYLAGSGWKEYKKSQAVCGVPLPAGLKESQELPQPIFTPATKEESGHDINISEQEMAKRVGPQITETLKKASIAIYSMARDYAAKRGIIIADTKFEFARRADGKLMLVDEALTPDSSRFWPADSYAPGGSPASFDKQFVRDYLESLTWDKTPPAPALPGEIVRKTSEKYLQALKQLTGRDL